MTVKNAQIGIERDCCELDHRGGSERITARIVGFEVELGVLRSREVRHIQRALDSRLVVSEGQFIIELGAGVESGVAGSGVFKHYFEADSF